MTTTRKQLNRSNRKKTPTGFLGYSRQELIDLKASVDMGYENMVNFFGFKLRYDRAHPHGAYDPSFRYKLWRSGRKLSELLSKPQTSDHSSDSA